MESVSTIWALGVLSAHSCLILTVEIKWQHSATRVKVLRHDQTMERLALQVCASLFLIICFAQGQYLLIYHPLQEITAALFEHVSFGKNLFLTHFFTNLFRASFCAWLKDTRFYTNYLVGRTCRITRPAYHQTKNITHSDINTQHEMTLIIIM